MQHSAVYAILTQEQGANVTQGDVGITDCSLR